VSDFELLERTHLVVQIYASVVKMLIESGLSVDEASVKAIDLLADEFTGGAS
jgi:hypothetical protein